MNQSCQVYTLSHDNKIYYVGQTTYSSQEKILESLYRFLHTNKEGRRSLTKMEKWLENIPKNDVILTIVEKHGIWDYSKSQWIQKIQKQNQALLNAQTDPFTRTKYPHPPKKKTKLSELPQELRGSPQNKYGGYQTQNLKGFKGSTYGAASNCITLSEECRREIEKQLKEKGIL